MGIFGLRLEKEGFDGANCVNRQRRLPRAVNVLAPKIKKHIFTSMFERWSALSACTTMVGEIYK